MNCRRVVNLISAYIDGELTGAEMLEIRRHLSDCPECTEEYESIRATKLALSRLATAVPRPDLAESIIRTLDVVRVPIYQQAINSIVKFAHSKLSPVAAALAASGLALVLLSASGTDNIDTEPVQEVAAVTNQDLGFIRQLNTGSVLLPGDSPLVVADPHAGFENPDLKLVSLSSTR